MLSIHDTVINKWPVVIVTNPKEASLQAPLHEPLYVMRKSTSIRYISGLSNTLSQVSLTYKVLSFVAYICLLLPISVFCCLYLSFVTYICLFSPISVSLLPISVFSRLYLSFVAYICLLSPISVFSRLYHSLILRLFSPV